MSNLRGSLRIEQRVFYLNDEEEPQTGEAMTRADKALVILLRFLGVGFAT
jgi:hypothetical protein